MNRMKTVLRNLFAWMVEPHAIVVDAGQDMAVVVGDHACSSALCFFFFEPSAP